MDRKTVVLGNRMAMKTCNQDYPTKFKAKILYCTDSETNVNSWTGKYIAVRK